MIRGGDLKLDTKDRETFRNKVYNKKTTSFKQLRNIEKELAQTNIRNTLLLRLWMKRKGFYDLDENYIMQLMKLVLLAIGKADLASKISLNRIIGDSEHSDFQQFKSYGRQFGKRRWYWRVYNYSDRIIVISELEND